MRRIKIHRTWTESVIHVFLSGFLFSSSSIFTFQGLSIIKLKNTEYHGGGRGGGGGVRGGGGREGEGGGGGGGRRSDGDLSFGKGKHA